MSSLTLCSVQQRKRNANITVHSKSLAICRVLNGWQRPCKPACWSPSPLLAQRFLQQLVGQPHLHVEVVRDDCHHQGAAVVDARESLQTGTRARRVSVASSVAIATLGGLRVVSVASLAAYAKLTVYAWGMASLSAGV